jgi:hypothetical protein
MRPTPTGKEMVCGPFLIYYHFPGILGTLRGSHIDIWPAPSPEDRAFGTCHGNKVCSVDWWQDGRVHISQYRSGAWEDELLSLLSERQKVTELDLHRRRQIGAPY